MLNHARVVLVGLVLAAVVLPASSAGAVAGYGDVDEGRYFTDPVQWSVDGDVTGVVGACFEPDRLVSRGEMAVWLWNMEGQPSAEPHSFTDVTDPGQQQPVSWLLDHGITTGTSATTFSPDDGLTRGQFAAFLWRLADRPSAAAHSFTDVVSSWQQGPVSWLLAEGITTGTSATTFSPDNGLTRGQLVTFLYRYKGKPTVTINPDSPTTCTPPGTFKAVSAGGGHSCGVRSDDTITCWNTTREGLSDAPSGTFRAVSAGGGHSCGVRSDDTIACWGANYSGQTDAPSGTFKAVTADNAHSCAISTDDTIECWGSNSGGRADPPSGTFQAVSAGGGHSCGVRSDDTIACWGANTFDFGRTDAPSGTFKAVTAGSLHSCGVRSDDTIVCWGANWGGATDAPSGTFQAVSAGGSHSCGVRSDDTIVCWGDNGSGESDAPSGTFKAVTAGGGHSCGVRSDDTIICWGQTVSVERIDGGSPVDLSRIDCPGGTIMGRFLLGQPTGCRLGDGTVLCLTAPVTSEGFRLYNAAEWRTCPDFDPDRSPCPTSQSADHGYIERWDYVFTSADQPPYVRPLWVGAVDLTPGLWFAELCVRNNEGSQIGVPGPQRAFGWVTPDPHCAGLGTFNTNVAGQQIYMSNGTINLLQIYTGWIGNPVFQCPDRSGPYPYQINVGAAGDWVLRMGKADLPFEVGTYEQSAADLDNWIQDRYRQITGS